MAMDRNTRTAVVCLSIFAGMVGLTYASVPLYRLFCQITGYGGTTQRAETAPDKVLDRKMTVQFDANISDGLAWRFEAVQRDVTVKVGETNMAYYRATNITDKPVTGQAVFNVSPAEAGLYFNKIACFCFTAQILQPHQTVQMPVTFYVDPAIAQDREAKYITEITLSYTFHQISLEDAEAVLAPAATKPIN